MENAAKILLLGKSGAGKSSFINYFLGKNVAKAAAGKPVTQDYFIPYEIEDGRYPINIFDTKGLEALNANTQLDEIIYGIKKRNTSDDIFDWFHTIFYCVSMSDPRFQDFEANFIRRLQKELSQHIHIILTHCDACSTEAIAHMREKIKTDLGAVSGIEIFEVVCVSKKKRNGQIAEPYGKEIISDRVFDLLLEDIAYKLSCDYADTLWRSLYHMVNGVFSELDDFIDKTVKIGTLFRYIIDSDEAEESIDNHLDRFFSQLEDKIEIIQEQTDEKFIEILRPAAQLYASYRGIVTDPYYVDDAELAFLDTFEWMDTDWLDAIDENNFVAKIMPRTGKFMDENGELPSGDNSSLSEIFSMIGAGVGDLFNLKKNIKKVLQELHWNLMHQTIPSQDEIQAEAYGRIVQYIKPEPPSPWFG